MTPHTVIAAKYRGTRKIVFRVMRTVVPLWSFFTASKLISPLRTEPRPLKEKKLTQNASF